MSRYLLRHCTLWNQEGTYDLLLENDRIAQIAPTVSAEDARVIDMTGKTVLPGFFNAHVHLYGVHGPLPDALIQKFVQGGVTTVRDMGVTAPISYEEYQAWLSQRTGPEYPDVISAGKFLCGNNTYGAVHPSGTLIGEVIEETPEGAARAVDAMAKAGARLIKTGLDYGMDPAHPLDYLSEDVFRAICRRAKELGLPSAAHITKTDNFLRAAQWGLTESAHVTHSPMTGAEIAQVAESGMAFTATLSIFDMVSAESGEEIMDDALSNTGRLYRAGVPMAVGTDFMFENPPYQTAGIPVHELRLLCKAGLTVAEVIRAATIDSARICGVADETGSIEVGKRADLIAVSAPIDETFRAFESVSIVFHRGTLVKHDPN